MQEDWYSKKVFSFLFDDKKCTYSFNFRKMMYCTAEVHIFLNKHIYVHLWIAKQI